MSKEKQPQTTTTKAAKRPVGRPKKSAATTPPKRAAKARIVTVTGAPEIPVAPATKGASPSRGLNEVATSKPKKAPAKATAKPAIDPRHLREAYKEAIAAAKKYEEEYIRLKIEVASVKSDLHKTNRTVEKLRELIEELQPTETKTVKRSVWPWRRG